MGSEWTNYTVAYGDTVSELANHHGVSMGELLSANPSITNPDYIRAGQVIRVPLDRQASAEPQEGHVVQVMSHDGMWRGEARWEREENAYITQEAIKPAIEEHDGRRAALEDHGIAFTDIADKADGVSNEVAVCDLCHELWAMAQGNDPISDAVSRMEVRMSKWLSTHTPNKHACASDEVVRIAIDAALQLSKGHDSWIPMTDRRMRAAIEAADKARSKR